MWLGKQGTGRESVVSVGQTVVSGGDYFLEVCEVGYCTSFILCMKTALFVYSDGGTVCCRTDVIAAYSQTRRVDRSRSDLQSDQLRNAVQNSSVAVAKI